MAGLGDARPAPLRATDGQDTFTHATVAKRMPKIVRSVIAHNEFNEEVNARLEALAGEMEAGHKLSPLQDPQWNSYFSCEQTWFSAPWWVVENYLYRRILEIVAPGTGHLQPFTGLDPFQNQKDVALVEAATAFQSTVLPLVEKSDKLGDFVLRSLWGNKADLSLTGGSKHDHGGGGEDVVLVDDSDRVVQALEALPAASRSVVLVLDNCGLELLCDLVLVDALFRLAGASHVTLHAKAAPVFVSDAMVKDVDATLSWMASHGAQQVAKRLGDWRQSGRLSVKHHLFYTSPLPYWELPDDLKGEFGAAGLVIVKGDANYRRLLGDLHWPFSTPFADVTHYFPSALLALRTCKSGVCAGVSEAKQQEAMARHPGEEWVTNGHNGLVQFKP